MNETYLKGRMNLYIETDEEAQSKPPSKRILIIEDNPTYRRLLEMRLNSHGYDTLAAENGVDGLAAVKKEKPDLIIVDLMIPGMDGHRVCRELKRDPEVSHIPVVILTCRNQTKDIELARKENVDAYVLKSMMNRVLLSVLKGVFDKDDKNQESK